jgi:Xaa-Pro aminopeptidase
MNIFGTTFDYQDRVSKVRKLMAEKGLDALLVNLWVNQYYLSGMYQHTPWYPIEVIDNTECPLIIFRESNKEPVFLITFLTGNGVKEGTWVKDVRFIDREPYGKKKWNEYLAEVLKEKGVDKGNIGFEENVVVFSTYSKLKAALPAATLKPASDVFAAVRLIKDPQEIELIRQSVKIAEAGLLAGIEVAKPGVIEYEVQKATEIAMRKLDGFREIETMFQSGKRTSVHRFFATNWKKIEENDLGNIDIGCTYKGYGSDICRTWCIGKPTAQQKKVAEDCVTARDAVVKMVKPGISMGELYEFGENLMKKAGYNTSYTYLPDNKVGWGYVTYHGIGLGPMHDPPHVYAKDIKVETNWTIAITCGVRFADSTIRFEDNYLVTSGGLELLSKQIPWKL